MADEDIQFGSEFSAGSLRGQSAHALDAIRRNFPNDFFPWQLIHARHLLDGVSELKLIEFSASARKLTSHATEILRPITEYWRQEAERVGELSRRVKELYESVCPENLQGLTFEEVTTVLSVARDQRIGVVQVLPRSLVAMVLAQPEISYDEFSSALVSNSDEVIYSIEQSLNASKLNLQFVERIEMIEQAISCYQIDKVVAAQVLAVVLLDTHLLAVEPISGISKRKTGKQIRERVEGIHIDEIGKLQGWLRFYECAAILPIELIFAAPNRSRKLSRHSTIHHATLAQMSRQNCLRALLAVSSVVVHDASWY